MSASRARLGLSLLTLCHALPALTDGFAPGLYEIETQMSMAGTVMPAQTVRRCLTDQAFAPVHGGSGLDCKVTDRQGEGARVSWRVRCDGTTQATARFQGEYAGDNFTGNGVMEMQQGGGAVAVTVRQTGRRIGACPELPLRPHE